MYFIHFTLKTEAAGSPKSLVIG